MNKTLGELQKEHQSAFDKSEVKVKMVQNGFIVKTGEWFVFPTWEEAVAHMGRHFHAIKKELTT